MQALCSALTDLDLAMARARYSVHIGGARVRLASAKQGGMALERFRHPFMIWPGDQPPTLFEERIDALVARQEKELLDKIEECDARAREARAGDEAAEVDYLWTEQQHRKAAAAAATAESEAAALLRVRAVDLCVPLGAWAVILPVLTWEVKQLR
mmetsp:Transcript_37414/g.93074  ORF Transcript_37414/g.93074 Transcript_37414/m.93074 type:complete len:155 (+) Transcript_37414:281-745(+)